VELQRLNKRGVWFSYLPTLGVTAAFRVVNAAALGAPPESWAITFGASWTLWDGGLREANLSEASGRIAESLANARKAELTAREEVKRAQLDLESALANRLKAEQTVELARESQRLTDVSFKAGVATYLEVADANTALTSAEIGFVSERLQAAVAALRLLRSVGAFEARPLDSDLKDPNVVPPTLQALPGEAAPREPQPLPPEQQPEQQPAPQQ
ncbi:TolC family protein, partial [Pyxidicoccus sp. 3LG]